MTRSHALSLYKRIKRATNNLNWVKIPPWRARIGYKPRGDTTAVHGFLRCRGQLGCARHAVGRRRARRQGRRFERPAFRPQPLRLGSPTPARPAPFYPYESQRLCSHCRLPFKCLIVFSSQIRHSSRTSRIGLSQLRLASPAPPPPLNYII